MKERMLVALRVIAAFQRDARPVRADVELLRDWADPSERSLDADELACLVITEEIKRLRKPIIMREGDTSANV
jgi:hypothetical protein